MRLSPASQRGGTGSISGQLKWDLWWTTRDCDRAATFYLGFYFTVGIIPPKFHSHISYVCYQDLYNLSNCERRWIKRHHCSILTLTLTPPIGRTNGRRLESCKQTNALRDLRFLQQCFRSFRSSGMWSWVAGSVFPEVSNGHIERSLLVQFILENRGNIFLRNVG